MLNFKEVVTNPDALKMKSFFNAYAEIKNAVDSLKSEIFSNLANSDIENHKYYYSYLFNEIKQLYVLNYDDDLLNKYLSEYEVNISEFPKFSNPKLIQDLKVESSLFRPDFRNSTLTELQINFFKYFAKKEAQNMLDFIEDLKNNDNTNDTTDHVSKLKWSGKPSQLGFIISTLAQLGYIEAPRKKDGEINYSQFAKDVLRTFDAETTNNTLEKYLNLDSDKGQETFRKFNSKDFLIPDVKEVS
ncbi:hypothetical protein GSB9_00422 [Flavobacteriaceae bacterium GSB9]|nr:hypothetical protein GSB9_00422 [Flavobacteriaceae bacterium GSB9]